MVADQHHDEKDLDALHNHEQAPLCPIEDTEAATRHPARDTSDSITALAPIQLEQHLNTREKSFTTSADGTLTPAESVHVSRLCYIAERC
jgi:hypothetical protein